MILTFRFVASLASVVALFGTLSSAFVPFIDGGKGVPALYKGWFDDQVSKQVATAVGKAVGAGKKKIEVNFPPVPNVDEVKFGTPLNLKFMKNVVARDLKIPGGYKPGSYLSRNLIAYSNIHWAKKVAPAIGGGLGGKPVSVYTGEPIAVAEIKDKGALSSISPMSAASQRGRRGAAAGGGGGGKNGALILVNPGGEETWDRLASTCGSPSAPCVVLNNAYSTSYDLGNKRGYEEAYYLKRISKGWVFRSFPGPWQAYLERPDGKVELLKSYQQKPSLNEVAALVREESFSRYAIFNDRWSKGFGERL